MVDGVRPIAVIQPQHPCIGVHQQFLSGRLQCESSRVVTGIVAHTRVKKCEICVLVHQDCMKSKQETSLRRVHRTVNILAGYGSPLDICLPYPRVDACISTRHIKIGHTHIRLLLSFTISGGSTSPF